MSVIQVLARITPLNGPEPSGLLSASDLGGAPLSVERRVVTDPRTGLQYAMETTLLLREYGGEDPSLAAQSECERTPGLVCAPLSRPVLGEAGEGGAQLHLPCSICRENIPQLQRGGPPGTKGASRKRGDGPEGGEPAKSPRDLLRGLARYVIEGECLICGVVDPAMDPAQHLQRHVAKNAYRCGCCRNLPFHSPRSLYVHMLNKCETYLYTCEICGTRYQRRHLLTVHQLKNHTEPPSAASSGGDGGGDPVFRQNVPPSYACSSCGDRLTLLDDVALHRDLHGGAASFQCLFCGRSFSGELDALAAHVHVRTVVARGAPRKAQAAKDAAWACATCGDKKFYFEKTYVKHMKLIHGVN